MKNKRVIFMGTPEFSVKVLKMLNEITNVVLVVTKEDKPVGRKHILTPSPVKEYALENNIEVYTPTSLKENYNYITNYKPDIIITCVYGLILPKELIDYPKYGCINIHPSQLPKYRGATPINSSIINGDKSTALTIMYMDEHMDTGDIIKQEEVVIDNNDNVLTLTNKLCNTAVNLLKEELPLIFENKNNRIKQDNSKATYTKLLTKEDELLKFNDTSINIYNKVRGMNPYPGCYFKLNDNNIKVIECKIGDKTDKNYGIITNIDNESIKISTLDNELAIIKLKPSGKKEMLVKDYINGIKKEELIGVKVNV